jgi:hypothetical protein
MTYGSGQEWMIADHDEGIRQMKYAYDQGINVGHPAQNRSDIGRPLTLPTCTLPASPR